MSQVEDGSGTVIATYYYDPFGRRLWKEVSWERTYFHHADEGLVAETKRTDEIERIYGNLPNSTWTTDLQFIKFDSEYYFFHNDHLGTSQKIIHSNGSVVWSLTTDSFGISKVDHEIISNNMRYAGQYYDHETGHHYNWNRNYVPKIGKYTTQDPIGLYGRINLFPYVRNSPISLIDPWGLIDFYYYKNWGGPGWTAGQWNTWDGFSEEFRNEIRRQIKEGWDARSKYRPLDRQDTCYMFHDICCGDARMECRNQKYDCYHACLTSKKYKCDIELSSCLIDIGRSKNLLEEARE